MTAPGHLSDLLTLDAGLAAPLHEEMLDLAAELAGPAREVVDFGSGSGTGTVALARRFETAKVYAADKSTDLLERARQYADRSGVGARVGALAVGDDGLPGVLDGPVDLIWASSVLHEIRNADEALAQLFACLRPGGLLAVVEMDLPPTYLPDPGLEHRLQQAVTKHHGGHPHQPQWTEPLQRAGFTVERVHHAELNGPPADLDAARRSAEIFVGRLAPKGRALLDSTDQEHLDRVLASTGPDSLHTRTDLIYRSSRTAWFARRPS